MTSLYSGNYVRTSRNISIPVETFLDWVEAIAVTTALNATVNRKLLIFMFLFNFVSVVFSQDKPTIGPNHFKTIRKMEEFTVKYANALCLKPLCKQQWFLKMIKSPRATWGLQLFQQVPHGTLLLFCSRTQGLMVQQLEQHIQLSHQQLHRWWSKSKARGHNNECHNNRSIISPAVT